MKLQLIKKNSYNLKNALDLNNLKKGCDNQSQRDSLPGMRNHFFSFCLLIQSFCIPAVDWLYSNCHDPREVIRSVMVVREPIISWRNNNTYLMSGKTLIIGKGFWWGGVNTSRHGCVFFFFFFAYPKLRVTSFWLKLHFLLVSLMGLHHCFFHYGWGHFFFFFFVLGYCWKQEKMQWCKQVNL